MRGDWDARPLPKAPSKELNQLRKACLALRDEWGKYETRRPAQQRRLEVPDRTSHTILDVISQDLYGPLKSIQQQSQALADQLKAVRREDQQQRVRAIAHARARLSSSTTLHRRAAANRVRHVDAFVQRPAKTNDLLEAINIVMSPQPAGADESADD